MAYHDDTAPRRVACQETAGIIWQSLLINGDSRRKQRRKTLEQRNRFLMVSEKILGFGLPGSAVTVYLCLVKHRDAQWQCYPSHRLIAEEVHLSDSTVRRGLKALEMNGIIRIEPKYSKPTCGKPRRINNTYCILLKPEMKAVVKNEQGTVHSESGECSEKNGEINKQENIKENTCDEKSLSDILKDLDLDNRFDQIFAAAVKMALIRLYNADSMYLKKEKIFRNTIHAALKCLNPDVLDNIENRIGQQRTVVKHPQEYLMTCIINEVLYIAVNGQRKINEL